MPSLRHQGKTTMRYVTICHELLLEQHPKLVEQLRQQRMLLSAVNDCAIALKARHDYWKTEFRQANPGRAESQIASEALEMALADLQDALPSESTPDETALSLDAAMASLRRHPTPPA
jgi:hypothetical protein